MPLPDLASLTPETDAPDFTSLKPETSGGPDFGSLKPDVPKLDFTEPNVPRDTTERAASTFYAAKKSGLTPDVSEGWSWPDERLPKAIGDKLNISSQDVTDAMSEIQARGLTASAQATGMPPGEAAQATRMAQQIEQSRAVPGTVSKAIAGAVNSVNKATAHAVTSPVTLAAVASGTEPVALLLGRAAPVVQRALSLGFAAQALSQFPQVAGNLIDALKSDDAYKIASASADAAMTVLFGGAGAKYGLKGIAKDVPILNDALTRTVKENYSPDQLRDIYTRVNMGQGTPQEEDLVRFINHESAGKSGQAVRGGVQVVSDQSRINYQPLNDFLGVKAGGKTLKLTEQPNEGETTYASREQSTKPIPQLEIRPQVGEEAPLRQSDQETTTTQRETRPVNAGEVKTPTPVLTPDDLNPALLVSGKPVTGGNTHDEILANIGKSGDDNAYEAAINSFGDDANHVFVDKKGGVYNRDEAGRALGINKPLHSQHLNELKKQSLTPNEDWRVSVQGAVTAKSGETYPATVQIVPPLRPGETEANGRIVTPQQLKDAGHDVPDFTVLPQGSYSYPEAVQKAHILSKELNPQPPSFAAKYNRETLMQRPAWVVPGSMLDKVLGELREKNDPSIGRDIAPIWKTLTPAQRQDLAARGWVTTADRNPNVVALKIGQDVVPARKYYGMQSRIANRKLSESQTAELKATPEPVVKKGVTRSVTPTLDEILTGTPTVVTDDGKIFTGQDHGDAKNRAEEAGHPVTGHLGERSGWSYKGKNYLAKDVEVGQPVKVTPKDAGYRSKAAFTKDYKANQLKQYSETEDEFLRRRFCSGTVPKPKTKSLE